MTVESQTTKVEGLGNDSATVFSFSPLIIFATTDITVTLVDADDNETLLSEGTGDSAYSVSSIDATGSTGSITYPEDEVTPIATGVSVVIKRVLTLEQTTDLSPQGGYFANTQETAFDKQLMISLQQQEELDRVLKYPVGEPTSTSAELPNLTDRKGNVLGFDSTSGEPEAVAASGVGTLPGPADGTALGYIRINAGKTAYEQRTIAETLGDLSLDIGTDVQAWGALLDDFNTLGAAAGDGEFIVATGAGVFAYESGATVRQSLGGVLQDLDTLGTVALDGQIIVGTAAGAFAYESGATARDSLGLGASDAVSHASLTLTGAFSSIGITDNADTTVITIDSVERVTINASTPVGELNIGVANTDIPIHIEDTHAGNLQIKRASIEKTSVSGASVSTNNWFVKGTIVVGVSSYVTTGLGTSNGTSGYQIGTTADPNKYGAVVGTVAGTVTSNLSWTDFAITLHSANIAMKLTADGGNFNGTGAIRVTQYYILMSTLTG